MTFRLHPLVACLAAAATLSACKPAAEPADFTPPEGAAASTDAPTAPAFNAPTELAATAIAVAGSGGQCNLERVNGAMFAATAPNVSKGRMTSLGGWLGDLDAKRVPDGFKVRFVQGSRAWQADVQPTIARADVQQLLGGDAAFAKPGVAAEFDLSTLPEGTYRLYFTFERDGKSYACDNGRSIVLGP